MRFRLMSDAAPAMIWMSDIDHKIEYMNKGKLDFLEKNKNYSTIMELTEIFHPEDKQKYMNTYLNAFEDEKPFTIECRIKNFNNEYKWIYDAAIPRFLQNGKLVGYIGSGIDVTKQKNIELNLSETLKEKEILLKEIHHRVKNNLQIISSLLNLQTYYVKDNNALDVLKTSQDRIRSMALLHEKLYRSKSMMQIDIHEYLRDLINHLYESYKPVSKSIRIYLDVKPVNIDIDISISLGLIINELISNSLKHAFTDKDSGEIKVNLDVFKEDGIQLIIIDNGIGIPKNLLKEESKSFGLELVTSLVEQHYGKIEINNNGKTEFKILLKTSANKEDN